MATDPLEACAPKIEQCTTIVSTEFRNQDNFRWCAGEGEASVSRKTTGHSTAWKPGNRADNQME